MLLLLINFRDNNIIIEFILLTNSKNNNIK